MEDYKAWVPQEYLAQYYATGTMTEDEQAILRFVVDFLKKTKPEINEMLEVWPNHTPCYTLCSLC
jgi:hypothetical protein